MKLIYFVHQYTIKVKIMESCVANLRLHKFPCPEAKVCAMDFGHSIDLCYRGSKTAKICQNDFVACARSILQVN